MSNITKGFLLIAAIVVFNSCKQPNSPETATIQGRVDLAETYWILTPPYNGVLVTIEGTNFSALTDDSGYFSFQGVPTGSYNVLFSKAGYGDVLWMSQTITGGGNVPQYWYNDQSVPVMYKTASVVSTLQEVAFVDTTLLINPSAAYLCASGSVTPDLSLSQAYESMVVYVSHTSDVSAVPWHYATFFYGGDIYGYEMMPGYVNYPMSVFPIDTISQRFNFFMETYALNMAGFKSGDSIYVAAYGAPTYGLNPVGDYYDPATKLYVFTAINQTVSHVIGAKMP
jgi:hypothetical protein